MQMNRTRFNSDEDDGFKFESKKGVRTMDNIIFGIACLTLTAVFGIAIYGAALNATI